MVCVVVWLPFKEIHGYFLSLVRACFEFLATLTFGELQRNHSVSKAFETIAKKECSLSTCLKQDRTSVVMKKTTPQSICVNYG